MLRKILTIIALLLCIATVECRAYDDSSYNAVNIKLTAKPNGAGKVYLSKTDTKTPTESDYKPSATINGVFIGSELTFYAIGIDGASLIGFSTKPNPTSDNELYSTVEGVIKNYVRSYDTFHDAATNIPEKQTEIYAIFSAIYVNNIFPCNPELEIIDELMYNEEMYNGTKVDKFLNKVGDIITLSAPERINGYEFYGWNIEGLDGGMEVIETANEYMLEISPETCGIFTPVYVESKVDESKLPEILRTSPGFNRVNNPSWHSCMNGRSMVLMQWGYWNNGNVREAYEPTTSEYMLFEDDNLYHNDTQNGNFIYKYRIDGNTLQLLDPAGKVKNELYLDMMEEDGYDVYYFVTHDKNGIYRYFQQYRGEL